MKKLIQYSGDSPVYAEGFSENCKRSCKGAIHLLPRKPVTVTNDEYDHIVKKYKEVAPKLKVLAEMKDDEGSEAKDAATAAPAAEEPSSPSPSAGAVEDKSKALSGEKPKKK